MVYKEDISRIRNHYKNYASPLDGGVFELEFRVRHSYGDWHWISLRETPYKISREGLAIQVIGTVEDITEQMLAKEKLRYLSTHDSLTGLYNRLYYEEELSRLERGRHFPVAVIVADIDGLRDLNDQRGYPAGDALIRNAADLIKSCFRAEDMVARISGDEFAVVLPDIGTTSLEAIQTRVLRQLEAFNQSHPKNNISLSFGFALAEKSDAFREIIREADRRMVMNKGAKRRKE
jgi:diguanylate cyclase (GGDEF)-like protein